jgi:20S proteasome subunit alpha 6
MEAVKQGSACVGIKSTNYVVLATFNRSHSELTSHQKKQMKVDDHIGISFAGLAADGRVLGKKGRSHAINHKFTFDTPISPARLVLRLADGMLIFYNFILFSRRSSIHTTIKQETIWRRSSYFWCR